MHWFIAALIPQALWSITNYIDKYLLDKYIKSSAVGALVIVSGLIGFVITPPIFIFYSAEVLSFSVEQIAILVFQGILSVLYLIPYFYALEREEPSIVVPIYQTVPIFGFVLGYFFLGEMLSKHECFGAIIIILSSIFLTLDFSSKRITPKWGVLSLMLLSSFIFALSCVLFKLVAHEASLVVSIFYNQVGFVLSAIIFSFVKSYRIQFVQLIRENTVGILSLNAVNEFLSIASLLLLYYATLLAPIALVQTMGGFQPVFVFVYGVFLTVFFPRIFKENLDTKLVAQKVSAIIMICIGSWLIN